MDRPGKHHEHTERPCGHAAGRWVTLVTLDQFEALPWCSGCGLCPGLTTGPIWDGHGEPKVLLCSGCGTPVVRLGR